MDILFKQNDTLIDSGLTLKDYNFINFYPSINVELSWAELLPYIKQSYVKYMDSYIPDLLLLDIISYIDGEAVDAKYDKLVELLRTASAYYTIYTAMPHLNVTIGDMGVQENSNERSTPAQAWRYKSTQWDAMIMADTMMDAALKYLYQEQDHFTNFTPTGTDWFNTTEDLQKYLHLSGRRAFVRIKGYLEEAESETECFLGAEFYAELLAIKAPSAKESKLISYIKKYISDYAYQMALPHLLMMIDGDGLKLISSTDNFNTKSNAMISWSGGANMLLNHLKVDVKAKRSQIQSFLIANADDFPTWRDAQPTDPNTESIFVPDDSIGGIAIG